MKINKCKKCSFWRGSNRCVSGVGNKKSGIMIVGETPSDLDCDPDLEHEPMIGEAGAILNVGLKKAGLFKRSNNHKRSAYITNAVKCYPSPTTRFEPVNVTQEHKRKCSYWLTKEIIAIKPKYVLLLGTHALQSFTNNWTANITKHRGFWQWSDKWNCWYYPTIHPNDILRKWGETSAFFRDLEKFVDGTKRGVKIRKLGKNYQTVTTIPTVKTLIKKLLSAKRIAWDLETTTTRFWETTKKKTGNYDDILGISVCWGLGKAAYIPFHYLDTRGKTNKKEWDPELKCYWTQKELIRIYKLIGKVLTNPKIKKDGQNTKFDINWMRMKGIKVDGVDWDTLQFHHLIDENTPGNLTYLTSYYDLNFPRYEDDLDQWLAKRDEFNSKCYGWIPLKVISKYACADVDAVYRISRIQRKLASPRQKKLYYGYSVPISKFASDMEFNGVLIDVDRISEMEKEYDEAIFSIEKKLQKLIKRPNFNLNSGPQMQSLLFDPKEEGGLGIKIYTRTKTGLPSTGKEVFEFIRRDYKSKKIIKILDMIGEIRKMKKMKSTYLTGLKKLVDKNNRIHTNYLTTGTVTGRLSSTNPNLQNQPRDPIFRSLFIAGPDRLFTAADYDQVEYKLIAWLALQLNLIKKFKDPDFDIHTYNSSVVRQIAYEEVTKEDRSYDKAVTFGMNYGRSNKSIAETYDRDIEEVDKFVDEYFKNNPKIASYRNKNVRIAKKQGYLETKTGRRRHFAALQWIHSSAMDDVNERRRVAGSRSWIVRGIEGNIDRQAINFPIQSYASDCLTSATDRVRRAIKKEGIDAKLVLTVHDCIGLDTSELDQKQMEKILTNEMPFTLSKTNKKTGKKISLDFTIGYDVAPHWDQ